ncbi:MAG TPA: CBS domain-containing protein [Bdellovibrionota bacterium]|nr:CBS domain-containing protein [Bdellovibrionota bacterium]
MRVREIMTKEVFTLRVDHKVDLADDIMNWQRIRHIPVVDAKNHLVGLLTHRDLLKASVSSLARIPLKDQRELYSHILVGDIMHKDIHTTSPDADLRDAAAIMIDDKIGCLPVVEAKKVVGILTEADFLTLAWEAMDRNADQKEFTSVRKYSKIRNVRSAP